MTNTQRREYLHGLIDYIEEQEKLGKGRLNMDYWHPECLGGTGERRTVEACGTVHCLAGWAHVRDGLRTKIRRYLMEHPKDCFIRVIGSKEIGKLIYVSEWQGFNKYRYYGGDKIGALRAQVDHVFPPSSEQGVGK